MLAPFVSSNSLYAPFNCVIPVSHCFSLGDLCDSAMAKFFFEPYGVPMLAMRVGERLLQLVHVRKRVAAQDAGSFDLL
jgi:hypothetical protein